MSPERRVGRSDVAMPSKFVQDFFWHVIKAKAVPALRCRYLE